jgi:DNA-directed RNA polymerase specialized sigma24 family protein
MDNIQRWDDARLLADEERPGESFAVFYRRHATSVLAFYARRDIDPRRAGRLTAETFASALADRYRYSSDRASAAPWLHAIASCKLTFSKSTEASEDDDRHVGFPAIEMNEVDRAEYAGLANSEFDVLDVLAYRPRVRSFVTQPQRTVHG